MPVKLSKLSKSFLSQLAAITPVEGCEEQWQRYVAAATEHENTQARLDLIFRSVEKDGGTSSSRSYPAFMEQTKVADRALHAAFGALDSYLFATKHVNDKTAVAETELRATVIDSLEDKLDELQFSVNIGLLGSKVAQAIRSDVIEFDYDVAFCQDCA